MNNEVLDYAMNLLNDIQYGFVDINGDIIINSMEKINIFYCVSSPDDVLKNKVGCCFDKVELERTIFAKYFETSSYALVRFPLVHSFIVLKKDDKYIYFEQSSPKMKGIFTFNSLDELLDYVVNKYIEVNKIKDINKLSLIKYDSLKPGMNVNDLLSIFKESQNLLPSIIKENESIVKK